MSENFELIMVAYPSADAGRSDFDALVKLVEGKTVKSDGVILVDHDDAGKPRVVETGDHLGRKGMGWGGGVGLLVGLFSPTSARRDRGRRRRRRAHRQVHQAQGRGWDRGGNGRQAGPRNGDDHRHRRRRRSVGGRAGARRVAGEVRGPDGQGQAVRAQGRHRHGGPEVQSRSHGAADPRQELRRRHGPDAQGLGGRLVDDPWPQGARGRAQRPHRPHRRRRLRGTGDLRRTDHVTQLHSRAEDGPDLQPTST